MGVVLIIVLSVAAVFIILSFSGAYYMYRFAIVRNKEAKNYWENEITDTHGLDEEAFAVIKKGEKYLKSLEWERILLMSHDGLTLVGHLTEHPEPRGMFLMAHGYRSSGVFDFSGAVEDIMGMGFSLLIIDQRAHGESEGNSICFGEKERHDIVRWAEYLKMRYPELPVILDGVSMGAATVAMGGAIGYPDNVRAAICDCGYTTPEAICKLTLKRWFHLPPFPIYYAAKLIVKCIAGCDLGGASSEAGLRALCERGVPILIAHGKADGFVPYYMAEENYAACTGDCAELFAVSDADHGMAYLHDRDGYIAAMERLFEKAGI